jgi:hypothetical protein
VAVLSSARSTRQGACSPRAAVNRASVLRLMGSRDVCRRTSNGQKYPPASQASPHTGAEGQVPCNSALSPFT